VIGVRVRAVFSRAGLFICFLCAGCAASTPSAGTAAGGKPHPASAAASGAAWVGTWASAQQLTEPKNMPAAPGFANSTLRQVVQVSLGGKRFRFSFSNLFGDGPLTVTGAHVARSSGGSAIEQGSDRPLAFGGAASFTLPAGGSVTSDAIDFDVQALGLLAVTLTFDASPPSGITGHPGSRTTSFLAPGSKLSAVDLSGAQEVEHWYTLSNIDVWSQAPARAVVAFGDSITDGRGSTTNHNDRWPNQLAKRLQGRGGSPVAVLNQGIGGNCVLRQCLGPSALGRFERDAITPPGVRWVIVLEGINDLGTAKDAREKGEPAPTAEDMIAGYEQLISSAHQHGVRIYGATLLPYEGARYFSTQGEADRQRVNDWMRKSNAFDAVIDFDAIARDPASPSKLSSAVDGGDHLHPSAAGYEIMANAIDLKLFDE
jgi:lysophospholipase L1-like esterase